ncbi:MAG TPA: hypothetical protein VKA60_21005 [Blastocatellia bacterium]|nr:hypothetical protein [Blastocatellia bacterium]
MKLIEEIQSFVEQFDTEFPDQPTAVDAALTTATSLLERFNAQAGDGVPQSVIRLQRIAASLRWLATTYARQDAQLQQRRGALAHSDKLRRASLELSIADLRKQVAEAKQPQAKARAQQILNVALAEYESLTS